MEPNEECQDEAIPLTLEMVRAGVAAFERWNLDTDPVQCMITDIFYAMWDARKSQTPNSTFTMDSSFCTSGERTK